MIFDWDPSKADSNQVKHGRTFGLAGRVFSDPKLIVYDVSREQDGEERQKAVGMVEGARRSLLDHLGASHDSEGG
jgi:uncharacterized DUF497 family protein